MKWMMLAPLDGGRPDIIPATHGEDSPRLTMHDVDRDDCWCGPRVELNVHGVEVLVHFDRMERN